MLFIVGTECTIKSQRNALIHTRGQYHQCRSSLSIPYALGINNAHNQIKMETEYAV